MSLPPIKRIALAGHLLLKSPARAEAYGALEKFLLCVNVDPLSTDLLYRVNRKRRSKQNNWDINRLTTWYGPR